MSYIKHKPFWPCVFHRLHLTQKKGHDCDEECLAGIKHVSLQLVLSGHYVTVDEWRNNKQHTNDHKHPASKTMGDFKPLTIMSN